jgi:hypothetical protein
MGSLGSLDSLDYSDSLARLRSDVRAQLIDRPLSHPIQILHGLLRKPPQLRLGSGQAGAADIKAHPFFAPIDWDLLMERKLEPPFKPDVNTDVDVRCVETC